VSEFARLLDPEILVPSAHSRLRLEFWHRMMAWGEVDMRIGPSTFVAFSKLLEEAPKVPGLAQRDFWAIVSRFASRGAARGTGRDRKICDLHVTGNYFAKFGHADNGQLLLSDLRSTNSESQVLLGTDSDCWSSFVTSCGSCAIDRVTLADSPAPGAISARSAFIWRDWFLEHHGGDLDVISKFASSMFPRLLFSATAWDHLGKLSGDPVETVPLLIQHLGVINDHAVELWASQAARVDREKAFSALGVTASPEGPRTHKNKKAMAARDFVFKETTVRCEWHTKVRPATDRIYFGVDGGVAHVGVITDHLPL
jgi:hypothetical protein